MPNSHRHWHPGSPNASGSVPFQSSSWVVRDATDHDVFVAARDARAVVISKDGDFVTLLERYGPPPQVLWITAGNTSNARMKTLLEATFSSALELLHTGETLIEIGDL